MIFDDAEPVNAEHSPSVDLNSTQISEPVSDTTTASSTGQTDNTVQQVISESPISSRDVSKLRPATPVAANVIKKTNKFKKKRNAEMK